MYKKYFYKVVICVHNTLRNVSFGINEAYYLLLDFFSYISLFTKVKKQN